MATAEKIERQSNIYAENIATSFSMFDSSYTASKWVVAKYMRYSRQLN